jgi:hypothetical protein
VGAVTGVIGSLQALEAIKIIVGLQGKKTCSLTRYPRSAGLTNDVKMGRRLCWYTPRWERRRSEVSSFESGVLVAPHAVRRARRWVQSRVSTTCSSAEGTGQIGKAWVCVLVQPIPE